MKKSMFAYAAVLVVVAAAGYRVGTRAVRPGETTEEHAAQAERGEAGGGAEVIALDEASAQLAGIRTAPVERGTVSTVLSATGEVVANTNKVVKVGSLVSGRLSRLHANVGDTVKAGHVLAVVDSTDVARARAAHAQAAANLRLTEKKLANTKRLAAAGVFAQKPLDEVRRERAEVASEYASARVEYDGEIASADSAVKTAEAAFGRTEPDRKLAQAEVERRKQLAAAGAYQYKPLEDAQNETAEAKATQIAVQSAVRVADSQLARADKLFEAGTASKRDLEAARAAAADAQASAERADARLTIAKQALAREQKVFDQKVYASREVQTAENELMRGEREAEQKAAELAQAKKRAELARSEQKRAAVEQLNERLRALDSMLARETQVTKQNLAGAREVVEAESAVEQAKVELKAAGDALRLLRVSAVSGTSAGVAIVAPIAGRVLDRPVNRGEVVDPTTTLFTLLNLSTVWVDANVYEKDLRRISLGQQVTVTATAFPDEPFAGKVTYVSDTLDEKTRTVKVRCEIANPRRQLKPGMFVQAQLTVGKRSGLLVPDAAVQREGQTAVVYVTAGDGRYEKRRVKLGATSDGSHEVLGGLKAGEKVVTEGSFLVKSQEKKGELGEAD
ncbi:MAG: hypothetical protein COZ06_06130 [Armatimonadetes bacterium CG_4_10_14_3_um_filter_66_18]|nr:efflux RND transporter periplasmic adaptor subunit [Armatimonadota bacterium]OIP00078.1 MAG: hypothetical protein AUJ96_18825 [Armatimonadetes bacterium CG2_30_66_41]PIU94758.1 MAG: hypothetical protein COS65_06020 [Armatimonadetes bacterium CG06_land_8_20_14_3_00_66_21]PIX41853.1 MAG: hypothetical protein COZ57_22540 [Armatimonadetes bacterium CG_4_8_14_3_um_filter_66_20]PIY51073.1 MAG: hypothetical protein COZ06_06130 [Armatimonadetes bacterium CG_4_10_14_3_um_filter_66_18]